MSATLGSTSRAAMLLLLAGSDDPAIRANAGTLTEVLYATLDDRQARAERMAQRNREKSAELHALIRAEAEGLADRFDSVQVVCGRMKRRHGKGDDPRTVREALKNDIHPNVGMQASYRTIEPST